MEAVKEKKPKPKARPLPDVPPPIPSRNVVVNGYVLPGVPTHAVGSIITPKPTEVEEIAPEEERVESPQPEELDIAEDVPLSPRVSIDEQSPAIDISKLIFPKTSDAQETVNSIVNITERTQVTHELPREVLQQPTAYPCVPELSEGLSKFENESVVKAKVRESAVIEEAPPYPELSRIVFPRTAQGLMVEQELLQYYHNPLYESTDEFVTNFLQSNEYPSGPLFSLLARLRTITDELSSTRVAEAENKISQTNAFSNCWSTFTDKREFKGKCGENKDGIGKVEFPSTMFSSAAMTDLKKVVNTNRVITIDQVISGEAVFRSLALQVQWEIIRINSLFMEERGLTVESLPCLVDCDARLTSRSLLLNALSDLFYYLRAPAVPPQFAEAVIGWILELNAVLQMYFLPTDGLFIINHILRLPSPVATWAAPMIQTYIGIQCACSTKTKLDYSLALLSHLMRPIKQRSSFLKLIGQSEKEDNAWTMLSDDVDEEGDFSFVTISETDLASLLDQVPIPEAYSCAFQHFSREINDRTEQFLALLAFQLLLMKILDEGLTTYSSPTYKQLCKQIGMNVRKSICSLSSHWTLTKNIIGHFESEQLQKEYDRVMLLVLLYLLNRESAGLLQFLVDLPYETVTEDCRKRCEFILRSCVPYDIKEIYDLPMATINQGIQQGGLKERTERLSNLDAVFVINAVSTIISYSFNDPSPFLKEIIDVCFCDETARDLLYKVGGEAIATIISKRPTCFDSLILTLDRNMEHMGDYAIQVLAFAPLTCCKVSEGVMSTLGKWLINKAPDDPANRLARKILSGIYWGYTATGELWVSENIHVICADIVMKAHFVHCDSSNGMITKTMKQISKMANKMAEHEQLFLRFCWDILIKLKLPTQLSKSTKKDQPDLAGYFITLSQDCLTSFNVFLTQGVSLLHELISSGSSTASVVSLSRVISEFYRNVEDLGKNKAFLDVFSRVIHVDQCSYAMQWLIGPSSEATPIVRLICSSISFYSKRVKDLAAYLKAWVYLLCINGIEGWNSDQVVLQILGTISRIAFLQDAHSFLGILDQLHEHYTKSMLPSAKEKSKGMFSMFSSTPSAALLIEDSHLNVSLYASYLLLLIESRSFPDFYQYIWNHLAKKDKNTIETAMLKASAKCSYYLKLNNINVYRWAIFVPMCEKSVLLPLVLQRLTTDAFTIRAALGQKCQFARKLLDCTEAAGTIENCKVALQKVCRDNDIQDFGFIKAVMGWLFTVVEVSRQGFDFSIFDLDYLLQMILAGENSVWLQHVNVNIITAENEKDVKLYAATCHMMKRETPRSPTRSDKIKPYLQSHALPFGTLPAHPNLTPSPIVYSKMAMSPDLVLKLSNPNVIMIHNLSDDVAALSEEIEQEDVEYFKLVSQRFKQVSKNLNITIRCSHSCPRPLNRQITVNPHEFDNAVDAQILANRNKREGLYIAKSENLINQTAIQTAGLEQIARQLAYAYRDAHPSEREAIHSSGKTLFYCIQDSLEKFATVVLLYPAASGTLENVLRTLAQAFIAYHPREQLEVMQKVLDGFVLSAPLVESFTPDCLSVLDLCQAYSCMSTAVRNPEHCSRAMQLLNRLSIDKNAANFPPHQFAPLMLLAFQNLESQRDEDSDLHKLCFQHVVTFVLHAFPVNFKNGLDLTLQGCIRKALPVSLLEVYVNKLGAKDWMSRSGELTVPISTCTELTTLIGARLMEARAKSMNTLYSEIGKYLGPLTSLMQLFVFTPVRECFSPDTPLLKMQEDLDKLFQQITCLWGTLVLPASKNVPPFSPSHEEVIADVFTKLVDLLKALPENIHIPAGHRNVLSLVWQFYYNDMSILVTQGTAFYYTIIEKYFIRLSWNNFYPPLHVLRQMDDCLANRSQDCTLFLAQLFVRIPWKDHIDNNVEKSTSPSYMAMLFSCFVRITAREGFYSKVAASLLQILKTLSLRSDWAMVTVEDAQSLAETVAKVMPFNCLFNATEQVAVLQIIWRKICQFTPNQKYSTPTLMKQQLWCKTQCALLLRGGEKNAPAAYNSLISEVDSLALKHDNLRAFSVVIKELITVWTSATEPGFEESVLNVWNEYLKLKPESPLVLCSLANLVPSLAANNLPQALNTLEKTIDIFFHRNVCTWGLLMEWVQFPNSYNTQIFGYLTTIPGPENKIDMLPLTLKTFLDFGIHEDSLFLSLNTYLLNLKPKHVTNEPAFVIVLYRFLVWYISYCQKLPPKFAINEDILPHFIHWTEKSSKDESSFFSNLVKSKKTTHSPKLRVIFTILTNFLTQQGLGDGVRPRCTTVLPVYNARLQAIKDASEQKVFAPFSSVFNISTSYFTQVDIHDITSAGQLILRCAQCVFKQKYLRDS
ncbi:unnamed protein product [Auanema sp. JU1783]|nr:unnamed protein product [Auanema sp. JU1783]